MTVRELAPEERQEFGEQWGVAEQMPEKWHEHTSEHFAICELRGGIGK